MAQKPRSSACISGFPAAPVHLRIAAAILDLLVAGFPWLIIKPLWHISPFHLPDQFSLLQGFFSGAALLWSFYYFCFRDSFSRGQSIGKRYMRLMVIGTWSRQPCTPVQSFLRNVLCWFNFLFVLEGIIMLANRKNGRRIGDFLAQTFVTEASSFPPKHRQ